MAVSQPFTMAFVRPLGFLKVRNFNYPFGYEGLYASLSQILYRSVKPLQHYGRFLIFQDGGRPPS